MLALVSSVAFYPGLILVTKSSSCSNREITPGQKKDIAANKVRKQKEERAMKHQYLQRELAARNVGRR